MSNQMNYSSILFNSSFLFSESTMAPKDLTYNVPDVMSGNYTGMNEEDIEIQYLPLSPSQLEDEIDELISTALNSDGK